MISVQKTPNQLTTISQFCLLKYYFQSSLLECIYNLIRINKQNKIMQKTNTQKLIRHQSLYKGASGESTEFQAFQDQQFIKDKKVQSHHYQKKQKPINSLSVYRQHGTTQNYSHLNPIQVQYVNDNPVGVSNPNNEKSKTEHHNKTKLQRYSKNNSHLKKTEKQQSIEDQKRRKTNDKIGMLKKIIEHYNTKSTERNYYSNLICRLGLRTVTNLAEQSEFVSVKKIVPKTTAKRQQPKSKVNLTCKVIDNINVNNLNIHKNYSKNKMINVEAHSINGFFNFSPEQNQLYERNTSNKFWPNNQKQDKSHFKKEKSSSMNGTNKLQTLPEYRPKIIENISDNCINIKVSKFRQFLFLINFTNHIYRQLDIVKYQTNFKVFVGKGNNNNLIQAIIKKRFWLQIVKNKEEANFIWTQLKEQTIYEKQNSIVIPPASFNKKQYSNIKMTPFYKSQHSFAFKQQEKTNHTFHSEIVSAELSPNVSKIIVSPNGQKEIKIKRRYRHTKRNTNSVEGNQSQAKLLTMQQSEIYQQMLKKLENKRKYVFNDRLKYLKQFTMVKLDQLNLSVIHNHLPLNGLLGNKKAMFYMLKQYYKLCSRDVFQVVPLTFHIRKGVLDDQFTLFLTKFIGNRENKRDNYWIMKPGQFSNRGQGIACTCKIQDIKNRINNLKKLGKNKSLILQQYIINPLLYNNRKFDIRAYMLVCVNNAKLRAYWYQDGYIRTSSYAWTLDSITDNLIHLTNDAIQKYSNNYGKYQPGNKLTYSELQRYLDTLPKNGKKYNFMTEIYPKIKQIATDSIKSAFHFIDPHRKGNNFEIFGFDFMIDTNFKPWLIEINTNPCLQANCPVLERIIPCMVQNAFRIAVDPIYPPPLNFSSTYKYNIPENALHYNKFQLIFDEQRDGLPLIELYKDNNIVDTIDDYEEDKQIYEQEGPKITIEHNQQKVVQ